MIKAQPLPVLLDEATVSLFAMLDPEHPVYKKVQKEYPNGIIGIVQIPERVAKDLNARWKLAVSGKLSTTKKESRPPRMCLIDQSMAYSAIGLAGYYESLNLARPGERGTYIIGPKHICDYIFGESVKDFSKVYYHEGNADEHYYVISAESAGSISADPLKKELFQ